MSRPASSLQDQLTCSVCLERYLDPRTLPCHHSFCKVCLDKVLARRSDQDTEEIGCLTIACPVCRKQSQLPLGGVNELPPAFLINNLLEVHKASSATYVNVQPQHRTESATTTDLLCDKHERVLEFYCSDCRVLLCSACFLKVHRMHDCDLVSDVYKTHRKLIENQLDLLGRDVTHVDRMIAYIDSANDRLTSEGDETKKAITDVAEQLHRHIEEEKVSLVNMVDQNIKEKQKVLKNHHDKGMAMISQMRRSESIVGDELERMKDSIKIMAAKDELIQLISDVRFDRESIKFTAPINISFSPNASPRKEIGFLFEPGEKDATKEIVVGKECRYMVYLPGAETNPICHLVPLNKNLKPSDCQVSFQGNVNDVSKYEISFTPSRVGDHEIILFPLSVIKKTTVAQFLVNSPFLQENRRQISKQILSKPSAMAITATGNLVVCETASDCVTILTANDGKKLSTISSLGSSKKCLNKPCCVGVTPDNCIIVVDSGKQCYRLIKIKMDGKLIVMTNLINKDTLQLQSPSALAVHPSGKIFIVDSNAHSIFIYNANLTFCHIFGGKGKVCGFFNQPHTIAFDSTGNAYISDSVNNRIQKFSTSEEGLLQVDVFGSGYGSELSHLTRPTALCISCYDTIFVTDEHKRIAAFDTKGRFLGEVRYSKISLTNPRAIVVGQNETHLSVLDSYVEALYIIL